jgi:hypothetical protein
LTTGRGAGDVTTIGSGVVRTGGSCRVLRRIVGRLTGAVVGPVTTIGSGVAETTVAAAWTAKRSSWRSSMPVVQEQDVE